MKREDEEDVVKREDEEDVVVEVRLSYWFSVVFQYINLF